MSIKREVDINYYMEHFFDEFERDDGLGWITVDDYNFKITEEELNEINLVGTIDKLDIFEKYKNLDLSKVNCNKIKYCLRGFNDNSIKNHKLPNSLIELNIKNNNLTELPELPDSLINLYCRLNKLTSLRTLPSSLQCLDCSYNKLTSLPTLPSSLQCLDCSYNNLTSFSNVQLPKSLKDLFFSNNELTSFSNVQLPNSLKNLICPRNQLASISILPTSLKNLNFGNINVNRIDYNPDYRDIKTKFIDTKITIGNYIIKSNKDYISYMEDYKKYLLSKVKSARK
tara:strand:- start:19 stop:870 length:852 start_codon:yes stop_codon:yes gene_type:complete